MYKIEQLAPIDTHWAVRESWAEQALGALESITVEAAKEAGRRSENSDTEPAYEKVGSTAIFHLSGPMTKKETSMSYYFGGTSTIRLRNALREAKADKSIKNALLVIDSPGGQAQGTADLADEIRAFGASKPIVGFVDGLAASAGYWAASACDAIYASRTSEVGCIGTYMRLTDSSQAAAANGVKVHVIRAGKFKGAGTPGTEVTPDQLNMFQREVDALNDHFLDDVAMGRGLTSEQAIAVADGRVHVGKAAQDLGLIDGVCTLDDALQMISSSEPVGRKAASNGNFEKHMANDKYQALWGRILAMFQQEGIDISAAGGTPPDTATPQATAVQTNLDPELLKKLQSLESEKESIISGFCDAAALTFAQSLIVGDKASFTPADENDLVALYKATITADNGGQLALVAGVVPEGKLTGLIRKMAGGLPPHGMLVNMVGDAPDGKKVEAYELDPNGSGGATKVTEKRREELRKQMGLAKKGSK